MREAEPQTFMGRRRPRVLLATNDRRFRALASALLSQRGYSVLVSGHDQDIAELALSEHVDVVLIDATASLTDAAREASRLGSLRPPVGIVAVSAESPIGLAALPVLPKWAPFDSLLRAIELARPDASREGVAGAC